MFLTFTPNPCLERTLQIPDFTPGKTQRIDNDRVIITAGGKGINAARVASYFGAKTVATGWVGRRQSFFLREIMHGEGIENDFVEVEADTRQSINIVGQSADGEIERTEIVENGDALRIGDGTRLLEKWEELLPGARLASIGGSYPPALARGFELHGALLCAMAHRANVPLIYDGKGEAFERALSSKTPPWAIKPNLEEAAHYLRRSLETPAEEKRAVRELLQKGVEVVLLSCGERGLYLGHQGGIEFFEAPKVEVVSPVGAGDSVVGAFAAKWLESGDLYKATRWGVAAGSASAGQLRPAFVTPTDAEPLLEQVKHHSVEITLHMMASA